MVMQAMLGSWNKNAGGGKHMGWALLLDSQQAFVLAFFLFEEQALISFHYL